jgi:hypothetical protein
MKRGKLGFLYPEEFNEFCCNVKRLYNEPDLEELANLLVSALLDSEEPALVSKTLEYLHKMQSANTSVSDDETVTEMSRAILLYLKG